VARGRTRIVAGIVTAFTLSGMWAGAASAAPDGEATRVAAAEPDPTPADVAVPMPDLTLTARLGAGGMNLWRIPLSDDEGDVGHPYLVRTLSTGGFSYDNSRTLGGDFGNITAGDDGTADHVIWHGTADGSIKVWGVAGGSDTTPRLWLTLPHSSGWTWANSRPMVADVNGDGWDDLVVRHRATAGDRVWVLRSNGQRLTSPVAWSGASVVPAFETSRDVAGADFDGDGADDLLSIGTRLSGGVNYLAYRASASFGVAPTSGWAFAGAATSGWSFGRSRQLIGDVTGDGWADIVTIHATSAHPGFLVWVQRNCESEEAGLEPDCFEPPVLWKTMSTGGWSYANSRQYLADTNGDYTLDLVSVHYVGSGGMIVWRQLSNGSTFGSPQMVADLRTGGWNFLRSRESVADTWGLIT
jgi:hypothetical protein